VVDCRPAGADVERRGLHDGTSAGIRSGDEVDQLPHVGRSRRRLSVVEIVEPSSRFDESRSGASVDRIRAERRPAAACDDADDPSVDIVIRDEPWSLFFEESSKPSSDVAESNEREINILPEISLRVGGFDIRLRPAKIFSRPVGDTQRHGNLGMDVLRQASDVTIDFSSMILTLR